MQNDIFEEKFAKILNGKKIVLGVCSSIAIYKAAELVSMLTRLGADVRVVMTENACKLMSPRIFQTLSRNDVTVSMWEQAGAWRPEHISLSDFAQILVVAPATANSIANFATSLAPDSLSCTFLATKAPVLIAPAMNCNMYENPAVQNNMQILKSRGVNFVEPDYGRLACGVEGKGRLPEIETIVEKISDILGKIEI